MLVAHASDTHDHPSIVRSIAASDAEVLILTGDCMNNLGRVPCTGYKISPVNEVKYQESWYRKQAKKWASDLRGRPVICVRGNHDFIPYTLWLEHYGANVFEITDETPCVEVLGLRWAGFRQVPYIDGEWAGETRQEAFPAVVKRALDCDPDILVTHAPPAGILDGRGYGIRALNRALCYPDALFDVELAVRHHFFGHTHEHGGKSEEHMGIWFHNGACHFKEHVI